MFFVCFKYVVLYKVSSYQDNINILERWFSTTVTCIKWGQYYSHYFTLLAGVRQGGVLSPFLFALFIDGLVDNAKLTNVGF